MAKRLSDIQKEEIIKFFISGKTVDEISTEFKCTKLTITRNLKNILGGRKYKDYVNKFKFPKQSSEVKNNNSLENQNHIIKKNDNERYDSEKKTNENLEEELFPMTPFIEIKPLDYEIENAPQKDLSSVHISEISFPKIVYMIVDKKIELETKYLKDYPDWQFLSQNELNRKTIEIYFDLKIAKNFCNKEQKVIKVPNTDVFKIVSPILLSRGITRIVSEDKLIAL